MKEKPLLSREYSISKNMFGDAFKDFQRKFAYPKNFIMTGVFAVIAFIYVLALIKNPENSTCAMLIFICVCLICAMWLNVLNSRRKLMLAIDGIDEDIYSFELFEDKVIIGTRDSDVKKENKEDQSDENSETAVEEEKEKTEEDDFFAPVEEVKNDEIPKTVINFSDSDIRVLEKKNYFIIYILKHMFYVVPKEAFSDEEKGKMKECFMKTNFCSLKETK